MSLLSPTVVWWAGVHSRGAATARLRTVSVPSTRVVPDTGSARLSAVVAPSGASRLWSVLTPTVVIRVGPTDFVVLFFFFFQAEDGIRDLTVTGVQTCALPILRLAKAIPCSPSRAATVRSTARTSSFLVTPAHADR